MICSANVAELVRGSQTGLGGAGCLLARPDPDHQQAALTAARPQIGGVDARPPVLPLWNELDHVGPCRRRTRFHRRAERRQARPLRHARDKPWIRRAGTASVPLRATAATGPPRWPTPPAAIGTTSNVRLSTNRLDAAATGVDPRRALAIAQTRAPGPRPAACLLRTRNRRQIRPATLFPNERGPAAATSTAIRLLARTKRGSQQAALHVKSDSTRARLRRHGRQRSGSGRGDLTPASPGGSESATHRSLRDDPRRWRAERPRRRACARGSHGRVRVRRDRDGLLNDELPPAAGAAETSFGLEAALLAEFERARGPLDEQLRAIAGAEPHALGKLDDRAATQALRLEREHTHHQDAARKQTERASELEQQATGLGWRARHEREQLRHNANLQRDHTATRTNTAAPARVRSRGLPPSARIPWARAIARDQR